MPGMLDPLAPPVGMKEIAAKAGVSIATVSMSLAGYPQVSPRTRQRIATICREMNYRPPRRALRPRSLQKNAPSPRPARLGFVLLGSRLMGREADQGTLHDLTVTTARQGMRMEVFCIEEAEKIGPGRPRILDFAAGVDALILTGYVDSALLAELEDRQIPHVLFGPVWGDDRALPGRHGQMVTPDAIAMAEHAVSLLRSEGHRRIAFSCGKAPRGLWNDRWLRGYRRALMDAGHFPDGALIHVRPAHSIAHSAAETFCALPDPPTAYVFPHRDSASEFITAMRVNGRDIPAGADIAGGSDQPASRFRIIGCDPDQIAQTLIHQLCQLHRDPLPCPARLVLPFHVINPA
jgi:LacI family transcriptional regulator